MSLINVAIGQKINHAWESEAINQVIIFFNGKNRKNNEVLKFTFFFFLVNDCGSGLSYWIELKNPKRVLE